tara:strand:+ start:115893 stop:116591 length:699 start_codon:yes stop_codon:yes gene_type:complete
MLTHTFRNNVFPIGVPERSSPLTIKELSGERSVHGCSPQWVIDNGTPIIKELTKFALGVSNHHYTKPQGYSLVVDARVQRMMPGMFPSIPGWHCDAVPRADYHSQPDLSRINPNARHFITTLSTVDGGVSNTLYMKKPLTVDFHHSEPVWQQAHRACVKVKSDPYNFSSHFRPGLDGEMMIIGADTLHTAQACRERGWRLFFRMSMMHTKPINEGKFVDQQQVYILSEENGW